MIRNSYRIAVSLLFVTLCACSSAAERKDVRILYDFEDTADVEDLKKTSENLVFDTVQDNGTTHGRNCCRVVCKHGVDYGAFCLGADKLKGWENFDYLAFDAFMDSDEKVPLSLEIFDGSSKNYHTRCTYGSTIKNGKQSVVIQINRSKRNNKEGRDWSELEEKDKIRMDALTKVKFVLHLPKSGRDVVCWIDNVRLLQEDAIGGKMTVHLPDGTVAFTFGHRGTPLPGFSIVEKSGGNGTGFNLTGANIQNCGKHWPDPLTGDGIYDPKGGLITFDANLADGEYCVWLAAGMSFNAALPKQHFLLKIANETLVDETATSDELRSEKYLFRFLKTQYSERENALFLDFIDRMYPVIEKKVRIQGGKLTIQASDFSLSALIVLPAEKENDFKKLSAEIRAERIRTFNSSMNLDPQKKPQKKTGDGAFVCFIPNDTTAFHPATEPADSERERKEFNLAGAPGQRMVFRLGLTPFADLGKCRVAISALKGPSEIPAAAARIYFQDYRVRGDAPVEAALIPSNEINVERGVSWCWWAWMKIPDDARPGAYNGVVTMTPETGAAVTFPINLTVYPFKLEEILPYSFGMYYGPRGGRKTIAGQLEFMREVGFTATSVAGGAISGVNSGGVDVTFDPTMWELAKAARMGRHPAQLMMGNSLAAGRMIGRKLGARVDENPGSEFEAANFRTLYTDYARKYASFIKQQGLPVAVEIVDEPREVPNPWNRNLKQTNLYGDWLKDGGIFPTFVTPMGDKQSGLDYTPLIDHADIISTHAGKGSEQLMKLTPTKNKILWLYNTGMDRLSWGFYNWRVGSVGRWEWHFCFWGSGGADSGYVNSDEWYNPFTTRDGFAPHAPDAYPGAMLFKSVFLTCAEGITDSAYIVTLEKELAKAEGNGAKADTVAKAKAFLSDLKNTIPFLPGIKNIANADAGALVGTGLNSDPAQCDAWRRKIAEFLIALK